jgi:hypothetical protein
MSLNKIYYFYFDHSLAIEVFQNILVVQIVSSYIIKILYRVSLYEELKR